MNGIKGRVDRVLAGAIALLLAAMVVNVLWQVFTRFVLKTPSSYTEELARYLMIWCALLGAAYVAGRGQHLALDLLPMKLAGAARVRLERVIQLAALAFALIVLVGGGGRLVWISLQLGQTSAALQWKLGWVYLAAPVAGACMAFYALCGLVAAGRRGTGEGAP